jgi:hypothetical protein
MMVAVSSSESSVLTGATQLQNLVEGILHSHHRENLKSYKAYSVLYVYMKYP